MGTLVYYRWKSKNGAAAMKNSMGVPQNIEVELPHDLVIPHLSIYWKVMKAGT